MRHVAATKKLALTALLCLGVALAEEPQEGAHDVKTDRKPNRLVHEKSPYLRQHAYNPVDWFPWGTEAFERAKKEDRPVFLSVGYSTCHWCHVMERESFESEAIAAFLNANFVSIKVDREERPDVDEIYMNAVQQFTGGHGGWPMSVFLTPDAKPFYAGTYFPPEDRYGHPGFLNVLQQIVKAWKERREELTKAGDQVAKLLDAGSALSPSKDALSLAPLDQAVRQFAGSFDAEQGGFGGAPKFPRPIALDLLLRAHQKSGEARLLHVVELTLQKMADGGMYDQIGGGFARYSTDADWLVPHFEKMLYDNAQLARTYVDAWKVTRDDRYARIARECLDYVLVQLTSPEGGFYCAEDADSEGVEGKFYVWTPAEVAAVLGEADAHVYCRAFGITEQGNFEEGGHRASVVHVALSAEQTSKLLGRPLADVERVLAEGRKKLFDARAKRVRPHRDEKVLTAWNGLAIAAMAHAGASLEEPRYVEAARRAAGLVIEKSRRDGRLLRSYIDGEARHLGGLDDYAFLIDGLLELYQATFEVKWLTEADALCRDMIRLFWDEKGGGFFHTGSDAEALLTRPRDPYDGAVPSGNSVAIGVLVRLSLMTGDEDLRKLAETTVRVFLPNVLQSPTAFPQMLMGLEDLLTARKEVVLAAEQADAALTPMLRVVRQRFLPGGVVMLHPGGEEGAKLAARFKLLEGRAPRDGAKSYVCEGTTCLPPVSSAEELERLLK
ncbi:MAG: thioredoxin domain-containing protein [Planctomycetota bacterium]